MIILQIAKQKLDCQIQSLDYKYGRNSRVIVEAIIHEKLTILFHYKICFNLQPVAAGRGMDAGAGCCLGDLNGFLRRAKRSTGREAQRWQMVPRVIQASYTSQQPSPHPATQLYLAAFTGRGQAAAAAAAGSVITDGHKYFSVSPPDIFLSRCRGRGQVGVVCQSSVVTIIAAR